MNSNESDDHLLDRYLDGLLSKEESEQFLQDFDAKELEQAKELQSQIDSSLKRMLSGMNVDEQAVEREYLNTGDNGLRPASSFKSNNSASQILKLAVAAAVLVAVSLGIWFNAGQNKVEVQFVQRELTEVYKEKLLDFTPYYFCDDDQRFASSFNQKVGVELALTEMPADRRMTGLSYLGGISRNTVAMLCEVEGKEVIVFVDREDESGIEKLIEPTRELNVFVVRKHGLVFAEVTPLDSAKILEHFKLAQ